MKKLIILIALILTTASVWADSLPGRQPRSIDGSTGGIIKTGGTSNSDVVILDSSLTSSGNYLSLRHSNMDYTNDILTASGVFGEFQLENPASGSGLTMWGIADGNSIVPLSIRGVHGKPWIAAPDCANDATCATADLFTVTSHPFSDGDVVSINTTEYTNVVAGTHYAVCEATSTRFGLDSDTTCGGSCATCSASQVDLVADTPAGTVAIFGTYATPRAHLTFEAYVPRGDGHVTEIPNDDLIATFNSAHTRKVVIDGSGDTLFTDGSTVVVPVVMNSQRTVSVLDGGVGSLGTGLAHSMTDIEAANVAGYTGIISTTDGGYQVVGFNEGDATALSLEGTLGTGAPTDTTGAVSIVAWKADGGSSRTAIADSDTIVEFKTGATTVTRVRGDGDITTTGQIRGNKFLANATTTSTIGTDYMGGGLISTTGAGTVVSLPDVCDGSTGAWVTIFTNDANAVTVDVADASDQFFLAGIAPSAGEGVVSSGVAYESATFICRANNKWMITGVVGTWAEETP